MKYLVNRETKEHRIASEQAVEAMTNHPAFNEEWKLVEADDEGWIPWSGGECPLPKKARCHWRVKALGDLRMGDDCGEKAKHLDWEGSAITHYRPILSETAENQSNNGAFAASESAPCGIAIGSLSVFDRLKSAIAASESIPGIIAEIDALLPEGYCVTKREVQPAEDMSDWRNWREGDLVRAISTSACGGYVKGVVYKIERFDHDIIYTERDEFQSDKNGWSARFFRFHSRPAKVAK